MAAGCGAASIPDLGPGVYAKWRASGIGAITEQLQRHLILSLLGDVAGRRALDLGCGDGDLALELRRRGAVITGIDASRTMVAAGKARAESEGADIEFLAGTAESIPFAAEQFDIVAAVTILCFVADAAPAFDEIARVLRPGGLLVIGELGKRSLWAAVRRMRAWLGSALWRRARFRTPGELRRLAESAGLVAGPVRGAIYYPRWRPAARLLAPHDAAFGGLTTFGAAFLALAARKPAPEPESGRRSPT